MDAVAAEDEEDDLDLVALVDEIGLIGPWLDSSD